MVVALGLALQQGGCEPPPPNEPQCSEVTQMQEQMKGAGSQSPAIAAEMQDDIAEMGAENNCVGFSRADLDKD